MFGPSLNWLWCRRVLQRMAFVLTLGTLGWVLLLGNGVLPLTRELRAPLLPTPLPPPLPPPPPPPPQPVVRIFKPAPPVPLTTTVMTKTTKEAPPLTTTIQTRLMKAPPLTTTKKKTTKKKTTTTMTTKKKNTTTTMTTKTTPKRSQQKSPGELNLCAGVTTNTHLCDPATNGTTYLRCLKGRMHRYPCPPLSRFNLPRGFCDWPDNIEEACVASPGHAASLEGVEELPPHPAPPLVPRPARAPAGGGGGGGGGLAAGAPAPKVQPCDPRTCRLPDCRCAGTDIPGNLPLSDVPQMILLTFDDGINWFSFPFYDQLFPEDERKALKNPNGCRTAATFFVSDDANDMSKVKTLWNRGNEMASHSQDHEYPLYWNRGKWKQQMHGMREKLAKGLDVDVSEIRGIRTPFLELGGETQFAMMRRTGITYDSTMVVGEDEFDGKDNNSSPFSSSVSPPVWPFSLHHPPTFPSLQPNSPKRGHPGVWEVPIQRHYDLQGKSCSMADSCHFPKDARPDEVRTYLRRNFLRHYNANRAPFMISLHANWFQHVPASFEGLRAFLNETSRDPNVWQVTVSQMLDWLRHPVPRHRVTELDSWRKCP